MKKTLGIVLVIGALALGYFGYTKLDSGEAEIKIGDLEISASDNDTKQEAYIFFGLAAVALIAGLMLISRKD